jgi:hypothetical protein
MDERGDAVERGFAWPMRTGEYTAVFALARKCAPVRVGEWAIYFFVPFLVGAFATRRTGSFLVNSRVASVLHDGGGLVHNRL